MRSLKYILYRFFLFLLFLIAGLRSANAQARSNEGSEFWAVFPSHVPANLNGFRPLANYSIFITGRFASSGVVSVGSWQQQFNLPQGNTVIEIQVPRSSAYIDHFQSGTVLRDKAIRVQVDPGKPEIVVYGHIFAGARSAASLILPKEALGQQYYSLSYASRPEADGGDNYIVVVATEPNTRIFMELNGQQLLPGGVLLPRVGDVYQFLSPGDLTGTKVYADPQSSGCRQFAMFSGTTNSSILTTSGCIGNISSDPLYQQAYPLESWGKTYGFIPFSSRTPAGNLVRSRGNYVRILAQENNTEVTYNGTRLVTLNAGQYYTSPSPMSAAAYISATKPIAVSQYALSQNCQGGGVGDPDMVILNPIEYNIKNITVYSSSKEDISESYVNILIRTNSTSSFRVNGALPRGTFQTLASAPEYSYMQLNLTQYSGQTFNLSANTGFNAIAYGFGDVESYSYSAGTNLASNQSIFTVNATTLEVVNGACIGQPIKFKLTLTSPATSLTWITDPNEVPVRESSPAATTVIRNNTTVYEYLYPGTKSYPDSGEKVITAIAEYSSSSGCSQEQQEIEVKFRVYNPPQARFSAFNESCANSVVSFKDESVDSGDPIISWLWDFGDGKSSDKQNPDHTYLQAGTYTVKLSVRNSTSCTGIDYEQEIQIRAGPVAHFSMSRPGCNNAPISFNNLSTSVEGNIVKWLWDMGDGSNSERTDGGVFEHQYAGPGKYQIRLIVQTEFGCTDTVNRELEINTPSLEAGNDLYVIRGGRIQFNIQATGTGLIYKWTPSLYLDQDDIRNPTVSPVSDTRYSITITSEEGCELTDDIMVRVVESPVIPNTFTPNGDGINDEWNILYLDTYPGVKVSIFNRFGVKLFSSEGYSRPWNGFFNGQELPAGTYYYIIETDEGLPDYSGWVALLK